MENSQPVPQPAARRRGHRKSRKGCASCKWRHIKCDEFRPSCRNCLDHGRVCDYLSESTTNVVIVEESKPWLIDCPPSVEHAAEEWRKTGQPPFPILRLPSDPRWMTYSANDIRHLHHMGLVSASFETTGTAGMSLWGRYLPTFFRLAASFDHVAYAIMALSANNLGWMTKSTDAYQAACTYQNLAIQGVRQGITNFSKANADAILASSILLSVQVHEWRSWGSLMEGVRAVIAAMATFKVDSEFSQLITVHALDGVEKLPYVKEMKAAMEIEAKLKDSTREGKKSANTKLVDPEMEVVLEKSIRALETFTTCSKGRQEPTRLIRELYDFVQNLRTRPAGIANSPLQSKLLHPFRAWLIWLPSSIVDITKKDTVVLITLAYFFAVAIAVAPLFSVINQDFYLNIRAQNIMEIDRMLQEEPEFVCEYCQEIHNAHERMEYPRDIVGRYLVDKMAKFGLNDDVLDKDDGTDVDTVNEEEGEEQPDEDDDDNDNDNEEASTNLGPAMKKVKAL